MKLPRGVPARPTTDDRDLPPLVATFLRGLSLGALVGAAIAGSVLLRGRRDRHAEDAAPPEPPEPLEPLEPPTT